MNEAISKLAEHEVGRNNTKSIECGKVFSSCMIEQMSSPRIRVKDDCKTMECRL